MVKRDIVVIGASAGGVEAVSTLAAGLPPDLPAALFVVVHFPPQAESVLPAILNRRGPLVALHPRDGEPIEHGRIYAGPTDRHLLVQRGFVHLVRGPQENGHRPAVDALFRSAALAYGPRVIAVVLTGFLDDGTSGIVAVKGQGGTAIVQDPEDALAPGMPSSAIEHADVDYVAPLAEIAGLIDRLVREPLPDTEAADRPAPFALGEIPQHGARTVTGQAPGPAPSPETTLKYEVAAAGMDHKAMHALEGGSSPSASLACPACGGMLWELGGGDQLRFRCRVGHTFTGETLLSRKAAGIEDALWAALRTLEESISLSRKLSEWAVQRGHRHSIARFERQIREAEHRAAVIRQVLLEGDLESATAAVSDGSAAG